MLVICHLHIASYFFLILVQTIVEEPAAEVQIVEMHVVQATENEPELKLQSEDALKEHEESKL